MITIWRVCKAKYQKTAFNGEGAKLYGGRWNQEGYQMVYTSQSIALAALEILVQEESHDSFRYNQYVTISAILSEKIQIESLSTLSLPKNWSSIPAPSELKDLGTNWLIEGKSAVLKVPSVIIPKEFNFLINPNHPDFAKMQISDPEPFIFDQRIFKK